MSKESEAHPAQFPVLLRREQIREIFGISDRTVTRWITNGTLNVIEVAEAEDQPQDDRQPKGKQEPTLMRTRSLSIPFSDWPEGDRTAWIRGCIPADPYDDDDGIRYGATLRKTSLDKTEKGYARWLKYLEDQDWLDPSVCAFDRITRARLVAYFKCLKHAGNADYTIIGRFQELEMAIKIMAPGKDTAWIRRPTGPTIYSSLRKTKRYLLVPDGKVLAQWGVAMMDSADPEQDPDTWRTTYRDGLLIAMFAARGRRRRSMHLLRINHELFWTGERYRIELQEGQHKTKGVDCFNLPDELTGYIRRYLDEVRPGLLQHRWQDELWISRHGTPLTIRSLDTRIARLTLKRFGLGFGPHRFRHAIATTSTLRRPGTPYLSAAVLRISPSVNDDSYVRAGQIEASLDYQNAVEARRKRLKARQGNRSGSK